MARVMPRAATFWSGAMESSRSRISASAAVFLALSNLRTLSPGTNRNDRIITSILWPAMHQPGAAATCNHLAPLVGRGMLELDDALGRARLADALRYNSCMRFQRVAVEYRLRKFY